VTAIGLAGSTVVAGLAGAGGSNGYRSHVWKYELQRLSDELSIAIRVSHFPPGTGKWNKVEHRLFSFP
jgi:PII-like signaling protein